MLDHFLSRLIVRQLHLDLRFVVLHVARLYLILRQQLKDDISEFESTGPLHVSRADNHRVRLAVRCLRVDTFPHKVLSLVLNHRATKLLAIGTVVLHVVCHHWTRHVPLRILQSRRTQTQLLSLRCDRIPIFFNLLELLFFRRACQAGLRAFGMGHPVAAARQLGDVLELLGGAQAAPPLVAVRIACCRAVDLFGAGQSPIILTRASVVRANRA